MRRRRLLVLGAVAVGVLGLAGTAAARPADGSGARPAGATVTSLAPTSGGLGTTVTVTGTGFTAPATLSFNGVSTTGTVVSTTRITAKVPAGATSGAVTVTTAGSTASAGTFTVTASILLSLPAGPPGTSLTVSGSGFGANEVVDLYAGTSDEALTVTTASGTFSYGGFTIPSSAQPGTFWVTAEGRHSDLGAQASFLVRTNWTQYGAGPTHRSVNPYENQLNTSSVSGLTQSWRTPSHVSGTLSSPAVANGFVYVGSSDDTVDCYVEATGAVRWTSHTGGPVNSSPAVVSNVVYVGSDDGYLYAFNAATGAQLWKSPTSSAVQSSPTVSGGLVYVGSQDGSLYAFNATTGAQVWTYATGSAVFSSPALVNGIVYAGSEDDNVYALNATTGALDWKATTGAAIVASPVVVGDRVYIGSDDGKMYAYRALSGQFLWSYTTGGGIDGTAAVANGLVYFGTNSGIEYALRAGTGAVAWSSTATENSLTDNTTYANGVLYIGDTVNTYALAASNGTVLSSISASGDYGSAVVVDGSVLVNDIADGFLTRYTLGAGAFATPRRPAPRTLHPDGYLRARH